MKKTIKKIINFLQPQYCVMCNKRLVGNDKYICVDCLRQFQRTNAHLIDGNPIEKTFWYHTPIEKATSWFFYEGERTRNVIHSIKYCNKPEIGVYLGQMMAEDIKSSNFFDGIDLIIPVPLHWKRKMTRSYNQSYYIAKGISKATGISTDTSIVKRVVNNKSQTHLSPLERCENVKGIFKLMKPELITGKHILLVDDVITMGATTTECAKEMMKAQSIKLSVISLAYAGPHFYINTDNLTAYNEIE